MSVIIRLMTDGITPLPILSREKRWSGLRAGPLGMRRLRFCHIMGAAETLAAGGEMQSHLHSRRFGIAGENCLVDVLMLAMNRAEMGGSVAGRQIDAGPRNRGCAQPAPDIDEIAVTGSVGDLHVEIEI